ncbi:beta-D-xylosidase 3-like [Bradysia coprophila]|uniref:beta-D-xylosidase 3-like n=1 Tax=Bradysia coprophila TaxID=38358 RepID=UPI00187D7E29|nr:beta-D-xylosidase 3-like [Bradysia coprophila]
MNRTKLLVLIAGIAAVIIAVVVVLSVLLTRQGSENGENINDYVNTCELPKNEQLPFCDSNLAINARVDDLVGRLTIKEKIDLLINRAVGASENVDLPYYNWWNEALHGVANDIYPNLGTHFRPPTEHSTVFPQIISLSSSFDRELFFRMANVTGNEARAFYNAGNAGLTFWSPNINIYRDPRWGRGQETPGEDPFLSSEYARVFINGLQGDEQRVGFLKVSACCKHFAAHSIEEDRYSFDAVVDDRDMADTYLPAFKACVENNVSSIMTAYSAINGVPATAHKEYITDLIRGQWGFDGYVVSDCGAVVNVFEDHLYTNTESETCHAVLDAGVDIECGFVDSFFFGRFLQTAFDEGIVTEALMDAALKNGFRVLMRLGYFEKEENRPYKEFLPQDIDNQYHQELSLVAARDSIVLLKNNVNNSPLLPLNAQNFGGSFTSLALIGPHVNGSDVFLGNYHGIPSSIKVPLDEIQKFVSNLQWELGCDVESSDVNRLNEAEELARTSSQVILFVGINTEIEGEFGDRHDILLPGLQPELISRVLNMAQRPVILVLVSGGAIDLSLYKNDPRVGAIVWAGYIGQSAGEAIAEVLFGHHNPSGRLTQTFYDSSYLGQVDIKDMNMRPVGGSVGRTYRFYTGEPVYPFGYGLSYTTFEHTFSTAGNEIAFSQFSSNCVTVQLSVRNVGSIFGDHSILWFVAPPNAGVSGRPLKTLVEFEKLHSIPPSGTRIVDICLSNRMFQLANTDGEFEIITGTWTLMVEDESRSIIVT